MTSTIKISTKLALYAISALFLISVFISLVPGNAKAVSASDWKPGHIIDDAVFFNKDAMNPQQIQAFLNSKVPVCDTWHNWSGTVNGVWNAPPYTCLKDFSENGKSAAQIIWEAGQNYGINPQVLIATLQKETALVTDPWAAPWQYQRAMGYACPDTAACDSQYYGFTNQVHTAAWQFRRYVDYPNNFNFKAGVIRNIRWSPNAACGSSPVYIETQGTAALYNYTPYQPNGPALNNMYGTGDGCSAYGNRNFWRTFNDWFGNSSAFESSISITNISKPESVVASGQKIEYIIELTNKTNSAITVDAVGMVGRLNDSLNGTNKDVGWQGPITLQPGAPKQLVFSSTATDTGDYFTWPTILYQNNYNHYFGQKTSIHIRNANLTLITPLSTSPSQPLLGKKTHFYTTIKNNEAVNIRIDAIGIPIKYYGVYSYDTGWVNNGGSIAPGEQITIQGDTTFDKTGPYTAWLSWNVGGKYTTLSPTQSYNIEQPVNNFSLSYVETPNQSPSIGENVTLKFKLRNNSPHEMTLDAVGVVGRKDNPYNGPNKDFGWVGPETFAPGEEKTYSTFNSNIDELNNLYSWVAIKQGPTYTHYNNWGFMLTPHMPNISFVEPLSININNPVKAGMTVPISMKIKNNEPKPLKFDAIGIPIKYFGVYSYDTGWIGPATLSASGQAGDSTIISGFRNFDKEGPYFAWPCVMINNKYYSLDKNYNLNVTKP